MHIFYPLLLLNNYHYGCRISSVQPGGVGGEMFGQAHTPCGWTHCLETHPPAYCLGVDRGPFLLYLCHEKCFSRTIAEASGKYLHDHETGRITWRYIVLHDEFCDVTLQFLRNSLRFLVIHKQLKQPLCCCRIHIHLCVKWVTRIYPFGENIGAELKYTLWRDPIFSHFLRVFCPVALSGESFISV